MSVRTSRTLVVLSLWVAGSALGSVAAVLLEPGSAVQSPSDPYQELLREFCGTPDGEPVDLSNCTGLTLSDAFVQ